MRSKSISSHQPRNRECTSIAASMRRPGRSHVLVDYVRYEMQVASWNGTFCRWKVEKRRKKLINGTSRGHDNNESTAKTP